METNHILPCELLWSLCCPLLSVDTTRRYCSASTVNVHLGESGVTFSSHQADTSGCGLSKAPWVIKSPAGQRINISLVDFGWEITDQDEGTEITSSHCSAYGFIVERSLGMNTTFCGGTSRESHVYLSASSEVEITLTPSERRQATSSFLLTARSKYTALHNMQ